MSTRISSLSLQPTREEKAVGLLSALLLMIGMLTILMLAGWLSHLSRFPSTVTRVHLRAAQEISSGSNGVAETARALEDQGTDDQPLKGTQAAEHLQMVSGLVNMEFAALERNGQPAKGNLGIGDDVGDGRRKGSRGPDGLVIPNWERWQIHYTAADIQEYAKILDAFHVELGVLGGGEGTISYARDLSHARPQIRQEKSEQETRLRFVFERGDLKESDRLLAVQAGLSVDGRIVAQFYPDEVRQQLEALERNALGSRPLASVRHTIFGIRQGARGWEFFVERVEPAQFPGGLAPL